MRTTENYPRPTAQERLENNLNFFIEAVDCHEASEGLLNLLSEWAEDVTPGQMRALLQTLTILNSVQRVQQEHVSCSLKVA